MSEMETETAQDEVGAGNGAAEEGSSSPGGTKRDANDYSKWDDISDSDEETSEVKNDELSVVERLQQAATNKSEGNDFFKKGENRKAADAYRAGATLLSEADKSKPGPSVGQQAEIDELALSLNLNLAMAEIKLEHWKPASVAATKALKLDDANVKALFRRGVALSRSGDFTAAKRDLTKVLELDATNGSAKKELKLLVKKMAAHKEKEKKGFGGLFDRAGASGFYDDKEEERKLKEEKKAAELEVKRGKWAAENERRADEEGFEAPTFEDWCKEEEKKEKKRRKDEEKKDKERRKAAKGTAARASETVTVDDEEDLDGLTKGYKKTSDGRTTSFFNNELDDKAKALIGDIAPKPIARSASATASSEQEAGANSSAATAATTTSSPKPDAPQRIDPGASGPGSGGGSAWNANGTTWEEADRSEWAKEALEKHLKQGYSATGAEDIRNNSSAVVKAMSGLDMGAYSRGEEGQDASLGKLGELASMLAHVTCKVTKVKKVEGDASTAVVRGRKRYLYDMSAEVEFEVSVDESFGQDSSDDIGKDTVRSEKLRETKYKGTINMTEIGSVTDDPPEMSVKFKKSVPARHSRRANEVVDSLKQNLTNVRLANFVADFQNTF